MYRRIMDYWKVIGWVRVRMRVMICVSWYGVMGGSITSLYPEDRETRVLGREPKR